MTPIHRLSLEGIGAITTVIASVPLTLTHANITHLSYVSLDMTNALYLQKGYVAGTQDGIVTVNAFPAMRPIHVFNAHTLQWVQSVTSTKNGNYLITGLDETALYLIMARDLPPTDGVQRYEPAVWDYVSPATDLTLSEQMQLWQSWQEA